jgi:hypothetical protein
MFRYIFPLNKKAKKLMKKSNMEWTRNYPKEKDLEWFDRTSMPKVKIDKPPFTFEDIIYNKKNVGATIGTLEENMI